MGNVLRGVILAGLAVGMAAGQIVLSPAPGGGGGGGAPTDATYWVGSANGSLSAEIVVNDIASLEAAIAAYDFNDAANLTTGNIAAARMSGNILSALGTATSSTWSAASNYVTAAGTVAGSVYGLRIDNDTGVRRAELQLDVSGQTFTLASERLSGLVTGASNGDALLNMSTSGASNGMYFAFAGTPYMILGEGNTALIQDQTATTGDTLFIVRRGAGESGNVFEVNWGASALDNVAVSSIGTLVGQTNSGGTKYQLVLADSTFRLASDHHIKFNSTTNLGNGALDTGITRSSAGVMKITDASTGYGSIDAAAYRLAGINAIIYPPSASEPVDCTTSNDGSMYFDTTDQKLCICANDGTDDEWLMSDDYSHLTGHCSL